jgi:hypothetical protein
MPHVDPTIALSALVGWLPTDLVLILWCIHSRTKIKERARDRDERR